MQPGIPVYDELVGLEPQERAQTEPGRCGPPDDWLPAMTPERRRRFHEQLAGIPLDRPALLRSGLAPFLRLPAPEPRTLTRARLAATLASLVAANGTVTRDEILAAGFDAAEIHAHFRDASRIAGLARMVV